MYFMEQTSNFYERLVEERKRLRLNQEEFGVLGSVSKHSQLNYEKGSRIPDADYLIAIGAHGVDLGYLLTGKRSESKGPTPVVMEALMARGIEWEPQNERPNTVVIKPLGLLWLANYAEQTPNVFDFTPQAANKLADFVPERLLDLHLQVVQLGGEGDKKYPQLLAYLRHNPPRSPWYLSPWFGLSQRNELDMDLGEYNLPLHVSPTTQIEPLLVLPDDVYALLKQGQTVTISADGVRGNAPSAATKGLGNTVTIGGDVGQSVAGDATGATVHFKGGKKVAPGAVLLDRQRVQNYLRN